MIRMEIVAAMMVVLTTNAAFAEVPSPPSRLGDFSNISCSDAKMHVTAGDKCGLWRGTQTGVMRYQAEHYIVYQDNGPLEYKITMSYAYDTETWMGVVHSSDIPSYITGYDDKTEAASSWSETAKAGSDFYRPFTSGTKKCFGFHRRGPAASSGTKYRTTGWFCDAAKTSGYTSDEARAVLAMIQTVE